MTEINSPEIADAAAPFPSFTALRAAHSELLQRDPPPEQQHDCVADVERFIQQAQATGAILSDDEERRGSQNILNYWASFLYRLDGMPRLVTIAKYNPQVTAKVGNVQCPYPGVSPFEESESQFFFGRQRQVDYMLNRLKEDRVLVLVGPSGSGKTSLVTAGLVPALKKDDPNKLTRFYFSPTVPGSHPLGNLARMVQQAKNGSEDDPQWVQQQVEAFHKDEGHLLKLIEEVTDKPAVIFIDQGEQLYEFSGSRFVGKLEEMLSLDKTAKIQRAFLGNLLKVVQSPGKRHIVVLVRRIGDYEPHFRRLPGRFKEVFEPARMVLPALYASELSEAIEKPAELFGVTFEGPSLSTFKDAEEDHRPQANETTVQALVKEITSEPVGLPLLQFTLSRLWEKREGNKIPEEAFKNLGGCRAALAATAENFFTNLDFLDQRACRRLLRQLVKLDGELRAHTGSVRRPQLYPPSEKKARVDSLLDRLSREQLIRVNEGTIPDDAVVELVHGSLLNSWPRMVSWIDSQRVKRRWSKVAAGVGLVVLLAGLFLLGALVWGRIEQIQQSGELARLSNKEIANNRFDNALLLGRQAYSLDRNDTTRGNRYKLLYALQSTSRPKQFLPKKGFEVADLTFSAENGRDATKVAAIDDKGEIVVWNLVPPGGDKTLPSATQASYPLTFSPDGTILASASLDPKVAVILWKVAGGEPRKVPQRVEAAPQVTSLAFNPNGKTLVIGGQDGSVSRVDLSDTSKNTLLYKHSRLNTSISPEVTSLTFDRTGNLLASGSVDGTAFLSDPSAKSEHHRTFAVRGEVKRSAMETEYQPIRSLAFSPNSARLAGSSDNEAFIWDLESGQQIGEFSAGPTQAGMLVSFSAGGELLAAFNFDGSVILWDVEAKQVVGSQLYKPPLSRSATFSNDGKLLGLPGENGVVIWDVFDRRILNVDHTLNCIAFNHNDNDKKLAAGDREGGITLWQVQSSNQHRMLEPPYKASFGVSSLAFSEDSNFLAAGLQGGTISLLDPNDLHQIKALDAQTRKVVEEGVTTESEPPGPQANHAPPVAAVSAVVFSPTSGSRLLAAIVNIEQEPGPDGTGRRRFSKIILWDVTQPDATDLSVEPDRVVTTLAFSKDGTLASGTVKSRNSEIKLWKQGKLVATMQAVDEVSSLAFSRDGQTLASGFDNGQILLWDVSRHERVNEKPLEDAPGRVTGLAFSKDDTVLAAANNRTLYNAPPGVVTLWGLQLREPIGNPLTSAAGVVSGIDFSSDGLILASGNEGDTLGSIVLWDFDLKGADQRFCAIVVDCQDQRPVADKIPKKSLAQLLYMKVAGWWYARDKL